MTIKKSLTKGLEATPISRLRKEIGTKSFGQRMLELKRFRQAQKIAKLKTLLDPFNTKISSEVQREAKKSLQPPPVEIEEEVQPYKESMVDKAMNRLREQARSL